MKKIIEKLLSRFGYILIKKRRLISGEEIKGVSKSDMANARGKSGIGLIEILKKNNQLRWLEVGTGGANHDGFD